MEMKKLAPWNWFQNEQEGRTGFATSFPTLRSGLRDPLTTMRTEMDRLLDSFGRGFEPTSFESFRPFAPAVDVRDEGKDYIVSVEIPGVDKKDIKLEITNGLLFIQGEKMANVGLSSAFAIFIAPPSLPITALQCFVIAINSRRFLPKIWK